MLANGCVTKRFKIKPVKTTAYRPQSNGALERLHHVLKEYLKQYTDKNHDWNEWLDLAMFSYNTSVHEGTKFTPFELVFSRIAKAPSGEPLSKQEQLPSYQAYLQDLVTQLTGTRKLAHDNLVKAKEKSKEYYDKKQNPVTLKVGNSVYLLSGPKST